MNLISCKNLTVNYDKEAAVENLSFSVSFKDYIFILGENGSGKSTLLKTILNLKKKSKGEIFFENLKRNEIGYLPQRITLKKDFPSTVFEIVLSGFVSCCSLFYSKKQKLKVLQILKSLKLENIKNVSFKELSKGQQQKVLLARALCATKKVLFLDEPCANLDPVFTKEFYSLIKKLNEEKNVAIVMVSHDIEAAILNAKKILHIKKKVLFFGEIQDYLKSEFAKVFLRK